MTIGQSFDETAAYYDRWMQKAIPGVADIFSVALQAIPFPTGAPLRVLDLGAGTGIFSHHVLGKYPSAHFTLVDLAEKLLNIARRRFAANGDQFDYVLADYRAITGIDQYDLIISSLSIHHLTHPEKQALFSSLYPMLRQGGVFINIDQIRGETPFLQEFYWEQWLAHVQQMGGTEEEINSSTTRRRTYDIDATLADQIAWLKAAGFADVDCLYKYTFVGVFFGAKR